MLDAAEQSAPSAIEVRSDWTRAEADALMAEPLIDLLLKAQTVHRAFHKPNEIETAQLLSIKTGGCPEDCGYCSQSAHFDTGLKASRLMDADAVVAAAERAKEGGAARFCMGAAWREPKDRDMPALLDMVSRVKALGLETCMTLGMLTEDQSDRLAEAGLDYYNHNIDTSPEYYDKVISTRTFEDRIDTLAKVRKSGMKVCCGGIVGMGEEAEDRIGLLLALATMDPHPESVPVNALMPAPGTPLAGSAPVDAIEFARLCALARIMMPKSAVRISAGRENMTPEAQALCFMAGANSIFIGDTLLTASNPGEDRDAALLKAVGLTPSAPSA